MKQFLSLFIAALLLAGCGKSAAPESHDGHAHEEEGAKAEAGHSEEEEGHVEGRVELAEAAQKVAGIEFSKVAFAPMRQLLQVPGTVQSTSRGRAVVTPPIAGRIVSIAVQLGDRVRQGQTLAILESPELSQAWSNIADARRLRDLAQADLSQAKAETQLALARVEASRKNLQRQRELAQAGAFSQAPLQQAQGDLNEAQSELLSVQKEQASHAEQFRRLENLFREGIVSKSELEAARLELQQDEIRLNRAKARIDSAQATYDRERNIAGRGLLNAKEVQTAESELRSSQLELDRVRIRAKSAESTLASAAKAIDNAQQVYRSNSGSGAGSVGTVALAAPIAGTVTHLDITRGQAVERTQTLMEVENLESVWVSANIPESESAKVAKGASVQVTVASLPGLTFAGVVETIGDRVDPKTRSIAARCLIAGAAGRLKPDMFAKVSIGVGEGLRSLAIPRSALLQEGAKTFVFVKDGDGFLKKEVRLGVAQGDLVSVLDGLELGESVVSKGAFVLSSEQKKDELKGHEH